jgi:dTDP-4-dehydrorhamnose reductase
MTVAIIGANGQLGIDVVAAFQESGEETAGLTHADLDVSSLASTRKILSSIGPSVIVNTAAMHHVEKCEKEPERAYEINALGAQNVSIVAQELTAKLVHVSTDYVFDGSKKTPYVESDPAAPLNVYGNSKLAGENFIRQTAEKYFIVRTSALYGRNPCRAKGGRNFVDLMLKLASERDELRVVDDEVISPTSTTELAKQIALLSQTDSYGLYHATAEGSCSWHEFARTIFEMTNTNVNLKIAAPGEFPAKVPRPKYSVLENRQLKTLALNSFGSWQQGLTSYLTSSKAAAHSSLS